MKKETLYDAIGRVDDALIEGAVKPRGNKLRWLKWAPVAACLAVVIGFASVIFRPAGSPGINGNVGTNNSAGFHSYAGPILPLTALEGGRSLTAERDVTFDLAHSLYQIGVTDSYTLTNPTEEDVTVELLYPVISSLRELESFAPVITVDGIQAETTLLAGGYLGEFVGTDYEMYSTVLSDGSYLAAALEEHADLSGIPVTVYKFTNAWGPEESEKIPNPTIRIEYILNYERTKVLSYGFNGGRIDKDEGEGGYSYSIPDLAMPDYIKPRFLVVLGDDIENLTTGGYVTGGWDTKKTIEYGVDVTRYETDLDVILREVFDLSCANSGEENRTLFGLDYELCYLLYCDYLVTCGELADDPVKRDRGLGNWDFSHIDRVSYLEFTVTVPAGGSVEVTASMTKEGSHNYPSTGSGDYLYGYELATVLGSNLTFTRQSAEMKNTEQARVIDQNFGFDLESGITAVELDPAVEHYYLTVMKIEQE